MSLKLISNAFVKLWISLIKEPKTFCSEIKHASFRAMMSESKLGSEVFDRCIIMCSILTGTAANNEPTNQPTDQPTSQSINQPDSEDKTPSQ